MENLFTLLIHTTPQMAWLEIYANTIWQMEILLALLVIYPNFLAGILIGALAGESQHIICHPMAGTSIYA